MTFHHLSGVAVVLLLVASPRPSLAGGNGVGRGFPGSAGSQEMKTPPDPISVPAAPPVLSTVPITPAGMPSQPGAMSGLPLQVGDLPPGTVAVRVVRQPFANVVGQAVELRIGAEGKPMRAETGSDGRAQFTGLAIGEHVVAVAVVDGERLTSQLFQLPAQGGVRVLLATGQGTPVAMGAPASISASAPAGTGQPATAAMVLPLANDTGPSKTALVLVGLFAAAGLGVWRSATRPRRAARAAVAPADPPASPSILLRRKDRLYAELVQLELAGEAGTRAADHDARREALIAELETIYAALGEPADEP